MISYAGKPKRRTPKDDKRSTRMELHVAGKLKRARIEAGMTQEQSAKLLDVSRQQVDKYENGTNRLSLGRLFILAKAYGKSIPWFVEGIDAVH